MTEGVSSPHHNPSLDGLRAVAVALVIGFHSFPYFPGGWVGVDIFFVLSGFLITSILMREFNQTGRISLMNFYMRRVLRLAPAYFSVILFLLVVSLFSSTGAEIRLAALASALYVLNWAMTTGWWPAGYSAHLWSLAAEEQFYLIWPMALVAIGGRRPVIWVGAAIVALVLWRLFLVQEGATWVRLAFGLDTRGAAMLAGCLAALIGVERLDAIAWPGAAAALLAVIVVTGDVLDPGAATVTVFVAIACAVALIVSLHHDGWLTRALALPPMVYTGTISYGLYLWSYPITQGGAQYGAGSLQPLRPIALIVLSYVAAAVSSRFLETPFLRMKHLFPRGGRSSMEPSLTSALRQTP
jgi:peptidoglycan/LPS O-acetylase OafA/YrhL